MTNIILCGGSGTRLWPLSRTLMPKQFVKLFNNKSLFQLTVERNQKVCNKSLTVSNTEQYFLALDQIEELNNLKLNIKNSTFLLEPIGRNTAPAIALACMALDREEIVLVTPSDHLIKDEESYAKVVQKAMKIAQEENLVTFGITPTYPETGFGYIQAKPENDESLMLNVELFKEKPNVETAKEYLDENLKLNIQNLPLKYYWNSGMFCFKAGVFLDELKEYSPEIYDSCKVAFSNRFIQNSTFKIQHSDMEAIPDNSIDYAVMEKSKRVKVVPASIGWSDLGSFESLESEVKSTKRVIEVDSNNNFVHSNKQVALIDIEDMIVVDTPDALLVSKKGSSQKVKEVVKQLNQQGSELTKVHTITHRPWGTYEVLLSTDSYKLKRIVVQPKKRLSLQKHYHRNEHWIVVSGTATVTVGEKKILVRPNESTYIKMGEVHRLENEGKIPVVLIEAQVGEYTGEDDIVRIEDDYDR